MHVPLLPQDTLREERSSLGSTGSALAQAKDRTLHACVYPLKTYPSVVLSTSRKGCRQYSGTSRRICLRRRIWGSYCSAPGEGLTWVAAALRGRCWRILFSASYYCMVTKQMPLCSPFNCLYAGTEQSNALETTYVVVTRQLYAPFFEFVHSCVTFDFYYQLPLISSTSITICHITWDITSLPHQNETLNTSNGANGWGTIGAPCHNLLQYVVHTVGSTIWHLIRTRKTHMDFTHS